MTVSIAPASKMSSMDTTEDLNSEEKDSTTFRDEFCEGVGLSGVKFVCGVSINALRRFLWTLLLLAGIGATLYQIGVRVQSFMKDPKVVDLDFTQRTRVPFPSVTICNQNTYRMSKTYNFSRAADPEITPAMSPAKTTFQMVSDSLKIKNFRGPSPAAKKMKLDEYEKEFRQLFHDISLAPQIIKEFYDTSYHLPDKRGMLIECLWNGERCSETLLSTSTTNMGSCLLFNPGPALLNTSVPGPSNGLELLLDVEYLDLLYGIENLKGFRVHVHDQNDTIKLMTDLGSSFQTGAITSISLKRNKLKSLSSDQCSDTSDMDSCMLKCISDHVSKTCGCRENYMKGDAILCDPLNFINCSVPQTKYIMTQGIDDQCKCTAACERVTYDTNVVKVPFSQEYIWQIWLASSHQNQSDSALKKLSLLRDWAILDAWNRHLTADIHRIAMTFNEIYTVYFLGNNVTSISMALDGSISRAANESISCTNSTETNVSDSYQAFRTNFLKSPFISFIFDDYIVEDFQAVLASDILRNKTVFSPFLQQTLTHINSLGDAIALFQTCLNVSAIPELTKFNSTKYRESLADALSIHSRVSAATLGSTLMKFIPKPFETKMPDHYEKSYAMLRVSYEDMTVTTITQRKADSLTSLICDIGGSFGLWIGASVLTICEVIDIIGFYCVCRKSKT